MKHGVRWMGILLLTAVLSTPVFATFPEGEKLYPYLPTETVSVVSQGERADGYDLGDGLQAVRNQLTENLIKLFHSGLTCAAKLLAVSLLLGATGMLIGDNNPTGTTVLQVAGVVTIVLLGINEIGSSVQMTAKYLQDLNLFSSALLTSLAACGAAAGAAGEAVAHQSAGILFTNLLIQSFTLVFVPGTYMVLGLKTVGLVSNNEFFHRTSAFLKNLLTIGLRLVLTLFVGYLTLTGAIGAAADTLGRKAAKTAVSTAIPVLGGVLGDAADAVYAGAGLMKTAIGSFGTVAVLSCAIIPLLNIGISYLAIRGGAACSGALGQNIGQRAMDAVGDTLGMLFAMCTAATVLIILSVLLALRIGFG